MAPKMPVPTSDLESTSSSEGEMAAPTSHMRRGLLGLAAAGAVGALAFVAWAGHGAVAPAPPQRMTVRSLLESDEVADVATDNLVAMGGVKRADGTMMDRGELKGHVSGSFKNISSFVRGDPNVARQLEELEVSDSQKAAVLKRVRHYSNPALVKLANEITSLYQKHHGMHQEIANKVLAATDLKTIAEALFPSQRNGVISMPVSSHGWKGEIEVDLSRRLSSSRVETLGGVTPQARTLLEGLEVELGDKMPKSPSRMLFSTTDYTAAPTYSTGTTGATAGTDAGTQSFMTCLQKAVPNPVEVCSCIASNMEHVVSMMMNFMKSKMPTL